MDKKRKTALAVVLVAVAGFLGVWLSGYSVAVNTSVSMPRGLYLVGPLDQPKRGEIAAVCIPNQAAAQIYRERDYLPPSKRCAVGLPPVLKPVAAVPGDDVLIDERGTSVNGRLIENSRVFNTDSQGLPIQHLPIGWHARMAAGEFFMLANHVERSLDSRYYGTVQRDDMHGRAVPLITF